MPASSTRHADAIRRGYRSLLGAARQGRLPKDRLRALRDKGALERTATMIRNGFYSYGSKALDGIDGGDSGVIVLRDGGILGGTSFFYFIGTYSCSGGGGKVR